jgi:hypothetical protein
MKKAFKPYFIKNIVSLLFFLFVAVQYFTHITRDVYSGDIGDLATAAYFFGVPHPPGYPTLTLLGFIFSRLPLALPIISKITLPSTIVAIIGLMFFYQFVRQQTKNLFISLLSTAILAFSYLYWLYAEVPEVFAISNTLLIIIYYFAWRFSQSRKPKDLYFTTFFIGLSLTDQQAIIAALPGILVFILPQYKRLWKQKNVLAKAIGFGLLGLLPYIYLPIAAATNPQINWMKEPTITNFVRMLLRSDYDFAKNLVGLDQRIAVMKIYGTSLLANYSTLGVIIGLLGFITAYRLQKKVFLALFVGFLISGPLFIFTITPGIIDQDQLGVLERFFMHSYILFAFFIPFGLLGLHNFFSGLMARVIPQKKHRQKIYATIFLLPFLIIPVQMVRFSGEKTDLSQTKIGQQLARDILLPLPKNAVVILNTDTTTFNSWYTHYVLGLRPDVILISNSGDKNEFKIQLQKQYQGPLKLQENTTKNNNAILAAMLPTVTKTRRVFSTEVIAVPDKNFAWLPRGMTFELLPIAKFPDQGTYQKIAQKDLYKMHIAYRERLRPAEQNLITPNIPRLYSYAVIAAADTFYVSYGNPQRALSYYRFAEIIDPDNSVVYAKMGIAQAELPNQCGQAVENIDTAIKSYRIYKPYYTFALRIYQRCHGAEKKITQLKNDYKKLFGKALEKDLQY